MQRSGSLISIPHAPEFLLDESEPDALLKIVGGTYITMISVSPSKIWPLKALDLETHLDMMRSAFRGGDSAEMSRTSKFQLKCSLKRALFSSMTVGTMSRPA
jgi:hypothetical protein